MGERAKVRDAGISLLLTLFILATLGGCKAPAPIPASPATPIPVPTPVPRPFESPLKLNIVLAQSAYLPGEEVRIRLSVENAGKEILELEAFPPGIVIGRPRTETTVWSLPAGGVRRALSPGESGFYEVVWDQRGFGGNLVEPGYYYVDVKDVSAALAGRVVSASAYTRVLIQHLEGAIDMTLDIARTQTMSGVVITLRRVELSSTGAKIHGLAKPPGWSPPPPVSTPAVPTPIPPPPPQMYPVPAEYSLDGGPVRDAGNAGFTWLQEGIGLTWDLIDPVPKGSKELTFVISRFGEWPGPWQFRVPFY